ncbi:MAG: homocitrate synthase/isopropylmalate synthase family protein [Nitrososphaeria archaeon]
MTGQGDQAVSIPAEERNYFRDIFPFETPPLARYRKPIGNIWITDTTLRDGQQGWKTFSVEESLKIYEVLNAISGKKGVIKTTELFLYTKKDREVIRKIKGLGFEYPKPVGWIRSTMNDAEMVIEEKLEESTLLCSISDYHIYSKFNMDRSKVLEKYLEIAEHLLKNGIIPKCTLEDTTRSDIRNVVVPFVRKLVRLSEKYKIPVKIKIADTLGVGLPFREIDLPRSIPILVETIIQESGIEPENVEFHGHNDLFMVTANHLAAWLSGAALSNCTLFGIGERSGNCPLEAMLLEYSMIKGSNDLNLKEITRAANLFNEMNFYLPEHYPLVGSNAFRTKAGIHIDALLKNPEVYLPFDPIKVLGIWPKVTIDQYSGRASVVYWIKAYLNLDNDDDLKKDQRVEEIHKIILKAYDEGRQTPFTDTEMANLVRKYFPEHTKANNNV